MLVHHEFESHISHNRLKDIHPDVFAGLSSLETLSLFDNNLTRIDGQLFSPLKYLSLLQLNNNNIEIIEDGAFFECTALTELTLHDNRITSLKPEMFKGLTSLNILDMRFNSVEYISSGTFLNMRRLRSLYLNGNVLKELNACMFVGLTFLQDLDLTGNKIRSIEDFTFSQLKNLEKLHIAKNQLKGISYALFANISQLLYLDISNNELESIQEFYLNNKLESLALYGNKFNCTCAHLQNLATLDVHSLLTSCYSSNRLEYEYSNMRYLDLWPKVVNNCPQTCGNDYIFSSTPCRSCENSIFAVCHEHIDTSPRYQCVELQFKKAYSALDNSTCNPPICEFPIPCSNPGIGVIRRRNISSDLSDVSPLTCSFGEEELDELLYFKIGVAVIVVIILIVMFVCFIKA